MVMMVLDGTFDVWPVQQDSHKTVVVNYCCWAFGKDLLELLLQLNKTAMVSDVKHTPANHPNELAKQLKLYDERKIENRC